MQATDHNGSAPVGRPRTLDLTVVIPAYNEAERLDDGLRRLAEVLPAAVPGRRVEVIVVDDGSADGTADRVVSLADRFEEARVLHLAANAGKGAAVRAGVAEARGDLVAFMDADMSIDPSQLGHLVSALATAPVAIGTRAAAGVVDYHKVARTTMGRAFNRLVNAVTGVGLADTQCGFKGFTTPVARLLFHFSVIDRFAFDVELLFRARRLGLTIAEVPVEWRHMADSRVRPVSDPVSMLADVLRSRVGLPAPLPVQALRLVPGTGPRALASVPDLVGRHLPLVDGDRRGPLLLFPLTSPAEVARLADQVATGLPGVVTGRLGVTASALEGLAPLSLVDAAPGPSAPRGPAGSPRPRPAERS